MGVSRPKVSGSSRSASKKKKAPPVRKRAPVRRTAVAKRTPAPEPDETNGDIDETNGDNGETNGESPETDAPVEETTPPTVEPKPKSPANRIGLADSDPPTYLDHPGERTHRVQIGPGTYEHTGEDSDGVWLYRPVK
jgi:hypothetical protein